MNTPEIQHERDTGGKGAVVAAAPAKNKEMPLEGKQELAEAVGQCFQEKHEREQPSEEEGGQEALARCEAVIEKYHGHASFWTTGKALREIWEKKLYEHEYESFEKYLPARWDMKKSKGYLYINTYEVMEYLKGYGFKRLPENAAQARALTVLPKKMQVRAWELTLEKAGDGRITAAMVKEVVAEMRKASPRKPRKSRKKGNTLPIKIAKRVLGIPASISKELEKLPQERRADFGRELMAALKEDAALSGFKAEGACVVLRVAEGITMTISFNEQADSDDAKPTEEPETEEGDVS